MAGSTVKDFRELPVALTVSDVKKVMGISKGQVYQLAKRKDFPAIRVGERKFIIPRDKLIEWLDNQAVKK